MKCSIKRNDKGVITEVLNEQGFPSIIFGQLNTNAFIPSVDIAANVAVGVMDKFSDEPLLFVDEKGGTYRDMTDLIQNGARGLITVTTQDNNAVFRFSTEKGLSQAIADGIQQGLITETKAVSEQGEIMFTGNGEYPQMREVNAQLFANDLINERGHARATVEADKVSPGKHIESILVETIEGQMEIVPIEQVRDNPQKYKDSIVLSTMFASVYEEGQTTTPAPKSKLEMAKNNMFSILKSLGISVSTLEEYRQRYKTKYGQEPTIQAIADLTNQVVAFAQGQDTIDNIAEETVHVLLEAYTEQESIFEALQEVEDTPEYAEFVEQYRELYGRSLSGVELEDKVRKEILGKIIAKEITQGFKSEVRQNIWQRILNYIRARYSPTHSKAIQRITNEVREAIQTQDISKFTHDLSSVDAFYYSAMSAEHKEIANKILRAKEAVESVVKGDKKGVDAFKLGRITEEILFSSGKEIDLVSSINTLVGIADRKLKDMERKLNNTANKGESINEDILVTAGHVDQQLMPFMPEFSKILEDIKKNTSIKEKQYVGALDVLLKTIDQVEKSNNRLQPNIKSLLEKRQGEIIESVLGGLNLTEEQKEGERKSFWKGGADASTFGKWIGIISDSDNSALKLIHIIISNMNTVVRSAFQKQSRKFIDTLTKGNLQGLVQDLIDGDTGYYLAPTKEWAENIDRERHSNKLIADATGIPAKEVGVKRKEGALVSELIKDDEAYIAYNRAMQEFDMESQNKANNVGYYKNRNQKYETHQISAATLSFVGVLSQRRAEIEATARQNGRVDKSKLTEDDRRALSQVKKDKAEAKAPLTKAGQLRVGLRIVSPKDLTAEQIMGLPLTDEQKLMIPTYKTEMVILEDGFTKDMLDDESRVAFDLNILDYSYFFDRETTEQGKPLASDAIVAEIRNFQQRIDEAETQEQRAQIEEEAGEFIQGNNIFSMASSYYDAIGEGKYFIELVEEFIEDQKDPFERDRIQTSLDYYRELAREKKWLLKQNKRPNSTYEIDAFYMTEDAVLRLLFIENEMEDVRGDIGLPKDDVYEGVSLLETETVLSTDFEKLVADSRKTEIEFSKENMTQENLRRTNEFERSLKKVMYSNGTALKTYQEKFINSARDRGIIDPTTQSRDEIYAALTTEFAKQRVASHLRQRLPVGFQQELNELRANPAKIIEYYEGRQGSFLEITPDYTWSQEIDNEENKNNEFKKQKYRKQLSRKYQNNKFFDFFGIDPDQWWALKTDDITQLTPTKNTNHWKAYITIINNRETVLEKQGESETVSKFLRPQVHKDGIEKLTSVSTLQNIGANLKDGWEEFSRSRQDDQDYGDSRTTILEGGGTVFVRKIPKYFTRLVDDPKMLTKDVLSAELLSLQSAISYEEKTNTLADIVAIQHRIAQNQYNPKGLGKNNKKIRTKSESNMYKKAEEYVNHMMYGVKQTREMKFNIGGIEVDATKMISKVQGYSSFINLGFNLFVDATGATTALMNNVVDRLSGDYYTNESKNFGNKTALSMMPKYLANYKKLDQNDSLSILMEAMGLTDFTERMQNSRNSRAIKIISSTPYLFSKLSNLTMAPSLMLTNLKELRLYKGEFLTSDQFKTRRLVEEPRLDPKTISREFKLLFNESLFDYISVTPEGVLANEKYKNKFESEENLLKAFTVATNRTRKMVMNVDGVLNQEEKLAIQRDVLLNSFAQHRGWFPLILSRRFKKGSYNYAMNKYEEGHYRSTFNTASKMMLTLLNLGGLEANRDGSISERMRDFSDGITEDERRNIMRTLIETSIMIMLMMIGMGIDFDDDDDEKLTQFSKYLYLRTTSEYNTQSALGLALVATEIYKSPVPSLKLFELANPFTWSETFGGNKTTTTSQKIGKAFTKYTPLKRVEQYTDIQNSINTYRFYNAPTLLFLGTSKKPKKKALGTTVRIN